LVDTLPLGEEEDTMPKTRPPYTPEFRQQIVELVEAGRSPEELSREFEPSAQTIRNWAAQGARDAGRRHDGPTTAEQEEIRRLHREVKQLRLEREILSKAAAWFARETNATDSGSSRS
jgi:transposase